MTDTLDLNGLCSRLLKAEGILLLCHKNPDGDTLGSAAALYWALKKLGKQRVAVLCADLIPARYDYMAIERFSGQFEPGYIVAIDVASIQLFGDAISQYTQRVDLCIDHHASNSGYADELYLDPSAAATAEIIYELVCKMGVELDERLADCLYTGISTDTGCFQFSNTTARTHEIAARLIEAGARMGELNTILFETKSRARLAIESIALSHLEYHFDDRCALIYMTREQIESTGVEASDLEGVTSLPRQIEGVQVGVTLRQQPSGSYKISVRTLPGVNACTICTRLGGGGHAMAAGCELMGGLDNAKQAILAEVERELCKES